MPMFNCLALMVSTSSVDAYAEQPALPPQPDTADAKTVEAKPSELVVTARKGGDEGKNGSKVYHMGSDLQAATGNASDVLKNIPSIEVDPDGGVSLRGDPHVQILINGVASAQMSGSNRGVALQDFAADQIDRIEVVTTPTAADKSEGSGGIINIITKRQNRPGSSGSISLLVGNAGRKGITASEQYQAGPWSLSADVGLRRAKNRFHYSETASETDTSGTVLGISDQRGSQSNRRWVPRISGNVDYDASKRDHLNFNASYERRVGPLQASEGDTSLDASGNIYSSLSRAMIGRQDGASDAYGFIWSHKYEHAKDNLKINLQLSRDNNRQYRYFGDTDLLTTNVGTENMFRHVHARELEGGGKYSFSFGKFDGAVGYDIDNNNVLFANSDMSQSLAVSAFVPSTLLTNRSRVLQTVNSEYFTLHREFSDWSINAGLRAEETATKVVNELDGFNISRRYINVMPSLNIEHPIGNRQKIHLGYSRRLDRPPTQSLTDYEISLDAYHLERGNPYLRPQVTDSIEATWEWSNKAASASLSGYYRTTANFITESYSYSVPPVIVEMDQNLGTNKVGGLETIGSISLSSRLKINGSATIYYNTIHAPTPLFDEKRSGIGYTIKLSSDWTPTVKDTFQISIHDAGRHLGAEGYFQPSWIMNLGYRRKINNRMLFMSTVSDVFNSERWRYITDIPILQRDRTRRLFGRVLWVGVTFDFGKKHENPGSFNYDK